MKGVNNYSSEFFLIIIVKGFLEVNIIFFKLKKNKKIFTGVEFGVLYEILVIYTRKYSRCIFFDINNSNH